MRILVVDENAERADIVAQGLAGAGHELIVRQESALELLRAIDEHRPDAIIIGADSPSRDTLEHVALATRDTPRPIVMFVDDSDADDIAAAIGSGVSAYIVDGLGTSRVKSIVDVAVARFAAHRRLVEELDQTREKLAERTLIERAKGILMQRRNLAEDEAFRVLRSQAMKKQQRLADVARALIDSADLLG
ncbi:MAG: ANTAR domain-containing protein [Burkholderiales bacterium]|nr:ANTAR domain-containing protein [Burkholderiales bacterium]